MPATPAERRELRKGCALVVPDFATGSAADDFRALADWCEANRVDHDMYGEGDLVEGFERKIAALLGKAAAMFAPSGVMAQLAAVRIWAEAAGIDRFGMHPTSHLAHHEEQAYAALMHCHAVPVGHRLRPMQASDLEAVRETLACVLVELPIREAGGQLPSWEELEALKAAARERRLPLHMDGARLWESAAYYDRDYAAIAAGLRLGLCLGLQGHRRIRRCAARRRRRVHRQGPGVAAAHGRNAPSPEPAGRRRGDALRRAHRPDAGALPPRRGPRGRPCRPAGIARQPVGAAHEHDASVLRRPARSRRRGARRAGQGRPAAGSSTARRPPKCRAGA